MSNSMPPYFDLYSLPEDERIELIGKLCTQGRKVAIMLEADETEKIARYVRKITERFPGVVELGRADGPVPNVVTLKFGLQANVRRDLN